MASQLSIPRIFHIVLFGLVTATGARGVTADDAEGRMRMARQIARERNDQALVASVDDANRKVKEALKRARPEEAEACLREVEKKVGLDPGGWSMAGQPLFHGTAAMAEQTKGLNEELSAAMKSGEPSAVRGVTARMLAVLGDQAGVPDGRRPGVRATEMALSEAEATKLFLNALASSGRRLRDLKEGKLLPNQMARVYSYILDAATAIYPFAAKHEPSAIAELDKLTAGVAATLLRLQQPEGHFPFPDLRGKNIRFGAMIDAQVAAGRVSIRDGWVTTPDPDGGTQFDTGVCGNSLIAAGRLHGKAEWTQAGLRAAEWAQKQVCCRNFNYNAFSVSLLSRAYEVTHLPKYLDAALLKYRTGVAPGQAPNGRWLDAHNARTVYHIIILRALGDLTAALPADRQAERAEVDRTAVPAIKALLDEFDAMGITVEALPELLKLTALRPADARLRKAALEMAASIVVKCTDGKRVKMGAQPNQLAVVPAACTLRSAP